MRRFVLPVLALTVLAATPNVRAEEKPAAAATATARVALDTSKGRIVLELDAAKAPITVESFLAYVKAGHYDGVVFHRVIPGFMIQTGGYGPELDLRPTRPPIKNEASNGLKNLRGTVAMARQNDPDTATSQFFVNLTDNPHLDPNASSAGYTVFGSVVLGMSVVDEIAAVKTGFKRGQRDVPVEPITLLKATVLP